MSSFGQDVKKEFPALSQKVHGKPLVYLDTAASALKPRVVIDRINQYYSYEASNVHRGAHHLSQKGTQSYEDSRETVAHFIGAAKSEEIVFTRGTTESINLIAQSLGRMVLKEGDEILLSEMEHHSNIVPWQEIAKQTGALIKVVKITDDGEIDQASFKSSLSEKTKIVSIMACSNVLGTHNDIQSMAVEAKKYGAYVVVDAAQTVAHKEVNVQNLQCDYLVFSGHKLFGPYGIGVLWGKEDLLNTMPPYQTGGSMISEVTFEQSTYLSAPQRFEAGTPNVAGAIGLASAINFVKELGFENIKKHDRDMVALCTDELSKLDSLKIYGASKNKSCIMSFNFEGIHASDIGSIIDNEGVAIRTGHHCCQPLMKRFGVPGTGRASFSIYNTPQDLEILISALKKAKEFF